jgi:hypothetical protein
MLRTFSRLLSLGVLIALTLSLTLAPAQAQRGGDRRLGVVDAFDNSAAASKLGAGWTRIRFQWNVIQPNDSGQWNDAALETLVNSEVAAGREVVGLIVNTPPWALKDGNKAGVPAGMELPAENPQNLWATFMRRLVAKYAGRVNHWIIWNEPDIWDNKYPGQTWGGSVDEFLQFQRIAYTVSKAANPNAVIHLAGFTFWWDAQYNRTPFFQRFLDALKKDPNAAANNYYFDVVTSHQYFRPDTVYDLTVWHHTMMRAYGFDKPVWLVETNAAPSLDPAWLAPNSQFKITLDEQGAFIVQALAMGLAAGAERIAVYKMADTPGDRAANPEPFGLVRLDGSQRPAFAAFQTAATYLSGFRSATLDRRDEVTQVTVNRGTQTTTVLWSRVPSPQRVVLGARAGSALVVDSRTGAAWTRGASGGKYTLDLPGATCTHAADGACLIGGWPILVVEQGSGGAASSQSVSLTATPSVAPSVTRSISPTVTQSASYSVTRSISYTVTRSISPTMSVATAMPTTEASVTPIATVSATPTLAPTFTPTVVPSTTPLPNPTPTLIASPTGIENRQPPQEENSEIYNLQSEIINARSGLLIGGMALVFLAAFVFRPRQH